MNERKPHVSRYLFVTFLAVALVPVLVLGMMFYRITSHTILENAVQSSGLHLRNNVQRLNAYFENIKERAISTSVDEQLYEVFSELYDGDLSVIPGSKMLNDARRVNNLLSKYFPPSLNLYSVGIITDRFVYNPTSMLLPNYEQLRKSGLFDKALEADGDVVWMPTYNYVDLIEQPELSNTHLDYQNIISAIRVLYIRAFFQGYRRLEFGESPPILMLNIKPETIDYMMNFESQTAYAVMGANGEEVVSSKNRMPEGLIDLAGASSSGVYSTDSGVYIISEEKVDAVGWRIVTIVSLDSMMGFALYMPNLMLALMGLLALIAVLLAWRFKRMKTKIDQIVKNSYERELYARDAEIQMLNVQLNPHFLYNTLGSFHFLALENGDKSLSQLIMALCKMLRYTARHTEEMTVLCEDVQWLHNYLLIMQTRDANRYKTTIEIHPALMDMLVPKLFLQPFIENALLHAFSANIPNASLTIRGDLDEREGKAIFIVRDNGKGMPQEKADAILAGRGNSVGIVNVQRRLRLIYDGRASMSIKCENGQGVTVTIIIPVQHQ